MGKFLKSGKVVIMLSGRYAGKKAVIVKTFDDGNQERKFGHCIVAGVDRQPRKITRGMSKTKQQKRSKIKPFVKFVNYNHIMPTRYTVDIQLKEVVSDAKMADPEERIAARKDLKKVFETKYFAQGQGKSEKAKSGTEFFFKKLRF